MFWTVLIALTVIYAANTALATQQMKQFFGLILDPAQPGKGCNRKAEERFHLWIHRHTADRRGRNHPGRSQDNRNHGVLVIPSIHRPQWDDPR